MTVTKIDVDSHGGIAIGSPLDGGRSRLNLHIGKTGESLICGDARQMFAISKLIESHLLHLIESGHDAPLDSLRRWVHYLKKRLDQLERQGRGGRAQE